MRFGVLGPLVVWTATGDRLTGPTGKVGALLATLLTCPGRTVSVDRLVNALWPDRLPSDPVNSLQGKVSRLRRDVGDAATVEFDGIGYRLVVDESGVDWCLFVTAVEEAREVADPRDRADRLGTAVTWWRGVAFDGYQDLPGVAPIVSRLTEARLTAMESLVGARLELGEATALAPELAELVDTYPNREPLRALRMRALSGAGRLGEAVDEFHRWRERLADERGLDPSPELVELYRSLLRHEPSTAPGVSGNLDAMTPTTDLVGRVDDLRALDAFARRHRLVTLTGPGGVGKTRLALRLAADGRGNHADGVWCVDLAALPADASIVEVAESTLATLQVGEHTAGPFARESTSPVDRLVAAVRSRRSLIVLDNCEHVIDAAASVAGRMLQASTTLRVLATSREPLAISGEGVWPVAPLGVPRDATEAAGSAAVRLFVARVAAAVPGFRLTERNVAAVIDVCRGLDGLPLALELAAPRVRTLGVETLRDRLKDRFALLTNGHRDGPPRQRTLRAVIDWSHSLTTPMERVVLRRLAVHVDGCALDAAESCFIGDGVAREDVLPTLTRLVDRSLATVTHTPDGPRFRLLESIAAYAAQRLDEANETAATRDRHARHYTSWAGATATGLRGPDQGRRLTALDAEAANVRAALDHRPAEAGLVVELTWYWMLRGRFAEAERRLGEAVDADPVAAATLTAWRWGVRRLRQGTSTEVSAEDDMTPWTAPEHGDDARLLAFLAFALLINVEYEASADAAERALAASTRKSDDWARATTLAIRAVHLFGVGRLADSRADATEALSEFERLGDAWGKLQALYPLAAVTEAEGDHVEAGRLHERGVALAEALGLWRDYIDRLCGVARAALLSGDTDRSLRLHERCRRLAEEHHYHNGEVSARIGTALTLRRIGDLDGAEAQLDRLLEWGRSCAFAPVTTLVLAELGFIAEVRGDGATALARQRDGYAEASRLGDPRAIALALEGLAGAHHSTGDSLTAARLLGAAAATRETVAPLPRTERADVDRITAAVTDALGRRIFAAQHTIGRTRPDSTIPDVEASINP
ncbi:BTAD domain-containing putative transcriptional regulator [Stackebrandtia soli]|uniref:BTAD domain-containing putative transcriptional regulator n=1 Tax=Stackebrandtia soli TaxID=1892856 RepID=UPI0039E9072D